MSNIIERVAKAAEVLAQVAEELQLEIDELPKGKVAEAAVYFFKLKEAHTALEKSRKEVGKKVDFLNKGMIPQMLEDEGLDKIQVPELARSFYTLTKTSCSMLDKEAGFNWLRDRGDGALITETVNAGTLASYMKDLVVNEGVDPSEDIFKLSTYSTTGVSKYTPKGA